MQGQPCQGDTFAVSRAPYGCIGVEPQHLTFGETWELSATTPTASQFFGMVSNKRFNNGYYPSEVRWFKPTVDQIVQNKCVELFQNDRNGVDGYPMVQMPFQ